DVLPVSSPDAMLLESARTLDPGPALAHLAEHGWARLGPVLDEAGLLALRERADDLMLGRRVIDGLFFQAGRPAGRSGEPSRGRARPSCSITTSGTARGSTAAGRCGGPSPSAT